MIPARAAGRLGRAAPRARQQIYSKRCQSTASSSSPSSSSSSPAFVGALAGGVTATVIGYGFYHFSGAKSVVNTAKQTKAYVDSAQAKFQQEIQDKAPNPNEALRWLRQVSTYYAGFIPGASGIVNSSFDDIDKVHQKHGDEVDKIVSDAFNELKGVSQKGMSIETAQQTWEILQKHMKRIGELAADAAEDIIDNHPQLKNAVGGQLDKLKSLGDSCGPEAKKQVEQTWDQIRDVTKSGISTDTVDKVRKLVQEKVEQIQKLGNEAWKKGLEQAKPYLDKNPKVKDLIENNADALKQGNIQELWSKVKDAAESGNVDDLQNFADQAKSKAKQSVGGLDQYLNMIPGGDQVLSRLGQLQDIAKSKGPEAQKLLEQTVKEIGDVLNEKSEEAKKLAEKADK